MPSIPGSQMSSSIRSQWLVGKEIQAGFAALYCLHKVSFVLQDAGERLANAGFIIDNQNGITRHMELSIIDYVSRNRLVPGPI